MKELQEKYNLPSGWIWTNIGNIAILFSAGTPERGNRGYFNGDIPWVKSDELNHSLITKTEVTITQEAIENFSAKIVPSGILLIALYGSTVGKLAFSGYLSLNTKARNSNSGLLKFIGL